MNNFSEYPLSFLSGFVQNKSICRVIAQVDQLKEQGSTASRVMTWKGKEGGKWYSHTLEWHATRICVLEKKNCEIYAVGPDGLVFVAIDKSISEEIIEDTDYGPRRRGHIRDLRIISKHIYAVGMGRQVYRRHSANSWVRLDKDIVQPLGEIQVSGFNSIDGFTESDLYAVGFDGEIQHYTNNTWHKIDSLTNLVLHRVRTPTPEVVYVSGQSGTLLRGNNNRWVSIDQDAITDDIWGMEWFKEKLYLASDSGLFFLNKDDELEPVETKLRDSCTFRYLHANDNVMWSFGPKNIAWTDGENWYEATPKIS